jgi:hypothetical protein
MDRARREKLSFDGQKERGLPNSNRGGNRVATT